jgi:hypothetical protein
VANGARLGALGPEDSSDVSFSISKLQVFDGHPWPAEWSWSPLRSLGATSLLWSTDYPPNLPWSLDRMRAETESKARDSASKRRRALVRPRCTHRIEVMRQRLLLRTTVSSASPISTVRSVAWVTDRTKPTWNGIPRSGQPRLDLRTGSFWSFVPVWIPAISWSSPERRGKRPGGSASRHPER